MYWGVSCLKKCTSYSIPDKYCSARFLPIQSSKNGCNDYSDNSSKREFELCSDLSIACQDLSLLVLDLTKNKQTNKNYLNTALGLRETDKHLFLNSLTLFFGTVINPENNLQVNE